MYCQTVSQDQVNYSNALLIRNKFSLTISNMEEQNWVALWENLFFAHVKTKTHISCSVSDQCLCFCYIPGVPVNMIHFEILITFDSKAIHC